MIVSPRVGLGPILRDMRRSRPARHGVLHAAVRGSRWVALGALAVAGVLAVAAPPVATAIILVAAGIGFVAGVPHGAVDHLLTSRPSGARSVVVVALLYAGTAALAWALLQWSGPVALAAVVVLSAIHFGLGELEVWQRTTGWRPGRAAALALATAGLGALVLPLARSGPELSGVATSLSPGLAPVIAAGPVRLGLVALWLVAAAIAVIAAVRAGHPTVAVDVVLIGALGLFVPPLVAFAVWFGGWHALRHTGRLLTVEPGCAAHVAADRPAAAVRRFCRLAALPSVAALAVVAALALFTVTAPDPTVAVAEVLQVLLALTVPHMLVVLWLDRSTPRTATHRVQESHVPAL